jgi:hypothetical protein
MPSHSSQVGIDSDIVDVVNEGRRVSVDAQMCWTPTLGGSMIVAPEAPTTDTTTTCTATDGAVSPPGRLAGTARRIGNPWAKPAALVVVVVVMWLIVLAIITVG